MSKQKLEQALANAIKETEKYREGVVNKYEHFYYIDAGTITREILNAISDFMPSTVAGGKLAEGSSSAIRKINAGSLREPVNKYVRRLQAGFTASSSNSSVLFDIVKGSAPTFVVRCYENPKMSSRTKTVKRKNSKGKMTSDTIELKADFYRAINRVRTNGIEPAKFSDETDIMDASNTSPLDELRAAVLQKLFNIINTDTPSGITNDKGKDLLDVVLGAQRKSGKREGGLLHLGHLEGFAVVEKRALNIYNKVTEEIGVTLGSATLEKVLLTKKNAIAKSKIGQFLASIEFPEEFTLVMDEDATGNISKEQERELLKVITQELLANDWAQQEGSMKPISAVVYDLQETLEESLKSLKPKKSKKPAGNRNSPPTKTKAIPIKGTARVTRTKGSESFPSSTGKAEISGGRSRTNWLSLMSIINRKLPEQVARNMITPGLIYRTGEFANSAQVVNIETTKEGYPSIVYDYQRSPYDVFDRTKGARPWNTPARDPKALVDKSIREIVQEMAIGRFYTRRA